MLDEKKFLEVIKDFKMEIVRDDGLDRHLKFKPESTGKTTFEIITWTGYFLINSGHGCLVFACSEDMFNFFCMSKNDFNYDKDKKLQINPRYWEEKLIAQEGNSPPMRFSQSKYNSYVKEYIKDYCDENDLLEEEYLDLLDDAESDILHAESEREAYEMLYDFMHDGEIIFDDVSENNFKKYTDSYIFNLYAIVWAIGEYRKIK